MPETNYTPNPAGTHPYVGRASTPVGATKSETITATKSWPSARKFHAVLYSNNSGSTHYIHLIASEKQLLEIQ